MSDSTVTTWKIDAVHSHLQFSIRHLMVSNVKGSFSRVEGKVVLEEADFTRSQVEAEIEVASLDTREPQRDAHLRSADFFDAEKYPAMRFRSSRIEASGEGYVMWGELTIKAETRPVRLEVEAPGGVVQDPWGGKRRGFEAKGEINRKDFGLSWNQVLEAGGVAVGDKVKLELEVELVRQEGQ